jgi:hypothetical protein
MKKPRTKGAGISDTAGLAIRLTKAILIRRTGGPLLIMATKAFPCPEPRRPDLGLGDGTEDNGGPNQRRAALLDSPGERQSQSA